MRPYHRVISATQRSDFAVDSLMLTSVLLGTLVAATAEGFEGLGPL